MSAKPSPRDQLVKAAARLLRERGFASTGVNDVLALSGAPKGSLYHYFPGGKDELALAAIRYAAERVDATLDELALSSASPGDMARRYAELLAGWMEESGYRAGCPVSTTLLETAPDKPELAAAARAAFQGWTQVFTQRLAGAGVAPERAGELAEFALAALEGALILARAQQSPTPLLRAGRELQLWLDRGG